MLKLRDQDLALRAISAKMKAAGVSISHAGVKNALAAADLPLLPERAWGNAAGLSDGHRRVADTVTQFNQHS
jgi:hypothetical protein